MPVKVEKAKSTCHQCDAPFKAGSTYTSFLHLENEQFKRTDLCQDCIDQSKSGAIAQWNVKVEKKKKMVLSESAIWQTLKNKDSSDIGEKPLTFILCLMMTRKRKLRMVKSKHIKGFEYQTFVNQSRGVDIQVKVPALGPAAFHQLQEDITNFFSGDA